MARGRSFVKRIGKAYAVGYYIYEGSRRLGFIRQKGPFKTRKEARKALGLRMTWEHYRSWRTLTRNRYGRK